MTTVQWFFWICIVISTAAFLLMIYSLARISSIHSRLEEQEEDRRRGL